MEDVAPVALIGNDMAVLLIFHTDIKEVPRAAWVAMTRREGEWQVLHEQAMELVVLTVLHRLVKFRLGDRLRQVAEESMVFVCQSTVEERHMRRESRTRNLITVAIETPTHSVEERVGKVTRIIGLIGCVLNTIVLRHNLAKVSGGGLQGCLQLLKRIGLLHESYVATYRYSILHHIADEVPSAWCSVV